MRLLRWPLVRSEPEQPFDQIQVGGVRLRVWKRSVRRGEPAWEFDLAPCAPGSDPAPTSRRFPLREVGNAAVALQLLYNWDDGRPGAHVPPTPSRVPLGLTLVRPPGKTGPDAA